METTTKNLKKKISQIINNIPEGSLYIFENREDFIETRTDWEELADIAENLYRVVDKIKELIK